VVLLGHQSRQRKAWETIRLKILMLLLQHCLKQLSRESPIREGEKIVENTGANAGKPFGFAGKSRVGSNPRPGGAVFHNSSA
jgi:hypothetical protein